MPAGITSQYGFLYQRYVFIKLVLENAGMEKFFVYEGIDDIDISEEQQISSVRESDNTFVQVKSGTVTQECWAKIIGNWLLIEEENPTYKIILENELAFDIRSDEIIKTVYDYFARGATKKTTSIANKIYRKFFQEKKQFDVDLIDIIQKIVDRASCEVISFEIMKSGIEETFKTIYCQDIKVYEMAKVCRCERFVECVNTSIDEAISRKKSFTLKYQDLINFVGKVRDEISDRQFTVDIGEMKKRKKPEAERLLNSDSLREVRQLRLVNPNNGFIVNELLKEMLYRDFRDVYSTSETTLISNIEETAYSNFEDTIYRFTHDPSPKQIFDETVDKEIPLSIVNSSPIYRHGCYVFLTSDEIDESRQITWGEDHE